MNCNLKTMRANYVRKIFKELLAFPAFDVLEIFQIQFKFSSIRSFANVLTKAITLVNLHVIGEKSKKLIRKTP